jgi:uncharacterized membrane protein YjfL (UPF0719 family)
MTFKLPDHFLSDLVVIALAGLLAISLLILAYKAWDWMTSKINEQEELNKGNTAVAIVLVGYMGSVAYIIGQVVAHVLGG